MLTRKRIDEGKSRTDFWKTLRAWHVKCYELAGDPSELEWADNNMVLMGKVEREMKLDDHDMGAEFAKMLLKPLKVIAPEPEKESVFAKIKKQSVFAKLKEKQSCEE